jgi:hypothetical protein
MKTLEELQSIKEQAAERINLIESIQDNRCQARNAQAETIGKMLVMLDGYSGSRFCVSDPATQEAIRALLIANRNRLADEAETKLKL